METEKKIGQDTAGSDITLEQIMPSEEEVICDMKKQKMEKTLVLIKPDSIINGIENDILKDILSIEKVRLNTFKRLRATKEQILLHYGADQQKIDNYGGYLDVIVNYMTSDDIIVITLSGKNIIDIMIEKRGLQSNPYDCSVGTIRHKHRKLYRKDDKCIKNFVHASSSDSDAKKEINVWL